MKIKEYVINRVLYPKVLAIEQPGIIVNRGVRALGNTGRLRFQYYFEDIYAQLQKQTYSELGKSATDDLFYKIGKDYTVLSLYLGKLKTPPSILRHFIIKMVFLACKSAGFSIFDNCEIHEDKLTLSGKDVYFFRKSENLSFFEGMASTMYSWVNSKNIECHSLKNGNMCKLICDKKTPPRHIPDQSLKKFMAGYDIHNFPDSIKKEKLISAKDLIQHKKLRYNQEMQSFYLGNPLYVGSLIYELTTHNYKQINRLDLLEKGVKNAAFKLAPKILESNTKQQQLEEIKTILCAFGWGFPYHEITKGGIIFTFVHPPYSKFGFEFYAYELNGYLNHIFKKKLKITKIETKLNPVIIKVHFK